VGFSTTSTSDLHGRGTNRSQDRRALGAGVAAGQDERACMSIEAHAELLGRAIITAIHREADEAAALATYQATRDRLSERLFTTTDAIASFAWDLDQVSILLRQVNEAMSDEVKLLSGLEPIDAAEQLVGTSAR
jgi:hypothetical protein